MFTAWLRRMAARMPSPRDAARDTQRVLDVRQLYRLVGARVNGEHWAAQLPEPSTAAPPDATRGKSGTAHDPAGNRAQWPPTEHLQEAVQGWVHAQVVDLLRYAHAASDTHPPTPWRPTVPRPPFRLSLQGSSAGAGSGMGVMLHGTASPGSVVALYPGIAYDTQTVQHMAGYPAISADNHFLMSRYDGVILDAKPSAASQMRPLPASLPQLPSGGMERSPQPAPASALDADAMPAASAPGEDVWAHLHPYALGHRVNHPPRGTSPNVMPCAFDYDVQRIEVALWRVIPNRNYRPHQQAADPDQRTPWQMWRRRWTTTWESPSDANASCIRALVLVATRAVHDEELFLNYRYNPAARERGLLPEWYWDPDEAASRRRWAGE